MCHGNLSLKNILQHGDKWKFIEPKAILGEVGFDAAALEILTNHELDLDIETAVGLVHSRLDLLSNGLSVPKSRLIKWFFIRNYHITQLIHSKNKTSNYKEKIKLVEIFYQMLK